MGQRTPIIAANWKMYKTLQDMMAFFDSFLPLIDKVDSREIVIAPSFVCLSNACAITAGSSVRIAAQNMYFRDEGAYTGEISPLMLVDAGANMVILGHSERRHVFGEEDTVIARKLRAAVDHGMAAVLCIGETLEEREAGLTGQVLSSQLLLGLALVQSGHFASISVAYEPVWAIGTGRTASLDQIQEAHILVRDTVKNMAGEAVAQQMRILYGGSVKPGNVREIMSLDDVDGALVGGASLDPESFAEIVKY